jgi:hypothetical protein
MNVTFISIHFVIICDVLLWHTYETHLALSLKSRCDKHFLKSQTIKPKAWSQCLNVVEFTMDAWCSAPGA